MTLDLFEDRGVTERGAKISDCGEYRYWLTRLWDWRAPTLGFIMLNPSTADAEKDDPTILRCMGFARRDGFGGIIVMNLFALRSSSPAALKDSAEPVGRENDKHLADLLTVDDWRPRTVVAAWGNNCEIVGDRHGFVRRQAAERRRGLHHLGLTQHGHPKHPLARGRHRVPDDQPLEKWL